MMTKVRLCLTPHLYSETTLASKMHTTNIDAFRMITLQSLLKTS